MKITFLGTAGSVASAKRGYPSILINEKILLDCGEGTTQKLIHLKALEDIKTICISHLHCDHFTGLFSLLWHYWISQRKEPITIIGPPGIKETIEKIIELVNTPKYMRTCDLNYIELKDSEKVQEIDGHPEITCMKSEHVPITFAYKIEVDRNRLCYTSDTKPADRLIRLAKFCEILITEATLPDKMASLAHTINHSTPSDAAKLAMEAECKRLVLFHISSVFEGKIQDFKADAEKIFKKDVIIAEDLMTLQL